MAAAFEQEVVVKVRPEIDLSAISDELLDRLADLLVDRIRERQKAADFALQSRWSQR